MALFTSSACIHASASVGSSNLTRWTHLTSWFPANSKANSFWRHEKKLSRLIFQGGHTGVNRCFLSVPHRPSVRPWRRVIIVSRRSCWRSRRRSTTWNRGWRRGSRPSCCWRSMWSEEKVLHTLLKSKLFVISMRTRQKKSRITCVNTYTSANTLGYCNTLELFGGVSNS